MSEPLTELLRNLPSAHPDPVRAEQLRIRCRTRLSAVAAQRTPKRPASSGSRIQFWQPAIAALGFAYVAAAIVQALRTYQLP